MKPFVHHFLSNGLSYGMIAGLLIVITRAAVYLLEIDQTNMNFGILNFVYNVLVLFLCLYLGTLAYRKKNNGGNLSFRQGFLSCVYIGFTAIVIIYVYDLFFYYLIAPNYLSNMLEPQITAITNNPAILPMQKIKLMETLVRYKSPLYMSSVNALMSLGLLIVISVITALFTVKKRPIASLNDTDN